MVKFILDKIKSDNEFTRLLNLHQNLAQKTNNKDNCSTVS